MYYGRCGDGESDLGTGLTVSPRWPTTSPFYTNKHRAVDATDTCNFPSTLLLRRTCTTTSPALRSPTTQQSPPEHTCTPSIQTMAVRSPAPPPPDTLRPTTQASTRSRRAAAKRSPLGARSTGHWPRTVGRSPPPAYLSSVQAPAAPSAAARTTPPSHVTVSVSNIGVKGDATSVAAADSRGAGKPATASMAAVATGTRGAVVAAVAAAGGAPYTTVGGAAAGASACGCGAAAVGASGGEVAALAAGGGVAAAPVAAATVALAADAGVMNAAASDSGGGGPAAAGVAPLTSAGAVVAAADTALAALPPA